MTSLRTAVVAIFAALMVPTAALAHGGQYQPPPPPDPPAAQIPPGMRSPSGGPFTPGGVPKGPTTPSGTPGGTPLPGGPPGPAGPTTGPGVPTGPQEVRRPAPRGGKVSPDRWSRWWYANRISLLDLHTRATRGVVTPSGKSRQAPTELWREEAQKILREALTHRDEDISSGAAIALGKAGDPDAVPSLVAVLQDKKRQDPVREAAALAIGLIGREPDAKRARATRVALQRVVESRKENNRLRAMAVYGLGLRGGADVVPFLTETSMSSDSAWDVPAAGATALGMADGELSIPELSFLVLGPKRRKKGESMRRAYAAHGLARTGSHDAVAPLLKAALDSDENVRRAAVMALGVVARPTDEAVRKLLVATVHRDKDRATRSMAALAIARIAPPGAARDLNYVYQKGDNLEQPFGAIALGLLARNTDDASLAKTLVRDLARRANADLRGALCIGIGLSGYVEGAPTLRAIVEDRGDPEVRGHAAVGLGLLGDRNSSEVLRKLLDKRGDPGLQREVALALGLLGDREAVKHLIGQIEEADSVYVQGSAAVALGRIGGKESAQVLLSLLQNKKRPLLARAMGVVGIGLLLDRSEGKGIARVGADLNWYIQTRTVDEVLTIL